MRVTVFGLGYVGTVTAAALARDGHDVTGVDVAKLKIGQAATITVDAVAPGSSMSGTVSSIDPVATISGGVPVYGVDVLIAKPNDLRYFWKLICQAAQYGQRQLAARLRQG